MSNPQNENNFLTRCNRIIGLDLSYFFKSGLIVAIRYGALSLLGLALTIGFARLGSKEILGQYQTILAVLGIVSLFSLPGLNMAALKSVASGNDKAVIQAVKLSFFGALLGVPILLCYAAYSFFISRDVTFAHAAIIGSALFPFYYALNTWYVFYEGRSQFFPVAWRTIALNGVVTISLLTALFLQADLVILLFLFLGIFTMANSYFFYEVYRKIASTPGNTEGPALDVRYGFYVTLQKFVFSLTENLPTILIAFFFGFEMLAVFQISFFFISAISGFLSGLSATYLPRLFRYSKLSHGRIIAQHLVLGIFLFVCVRVGIELLFLPLYGDSYRESFLIVKNFSYLILLLPLKTFLLSYFTVREKNMFMVFLILLAHMFSIIALIMTQGLSFSASVTWYLYVLNGVLTFPLMLLYVYREILKKRPN